MKYVNITRITSTFYDFRFDFAVRRRNDSTQAEAEEAIESIIMSPQHAKAFFIALANNIASYEEKNGKIPELSKKEGKDEKHKS